MARRKRDSAVEGEAPVGGGAGGGTEVGRDGGTEARRHLGTEGKAVDVNSDGAAGVGGVDPVVTFTVVLGWAWVMLMLGGTIMLLGGGVLAGGTFLSLPRAVFQAVSAGTLTGFASAAGVETFQGFGRGVVLFLTVVGTLFSLVLGGLVTKRVAGVRVSDGAVVMVAGAMVVVAVGVGLLDVVGSGSVVGGVMGAVGALGNSGVGVKVPSVMSQGLVMVLLPLSWVGGMGVVVVMDVVGRVMGKWQKLSRFSVAAMVGGAGAFLGLAGIFGMVEGGGVSKAAVMAGVVMGSGVPVEFATEWPRGLQVVAMLFAGVGLALGGTGAGVGVTTVWVIGVGVRAGLRGEKVGREVWWCLVYLGVVVGLVGVTWVALLGTEPQMQGDRLLMLASSAVANSGVVHDPVSVVGRGLFVLSGAMIAGRVVSIGFLWMLAGVVGREREGEGEVGGKSV